MIAPSDGPGPARLPAHAPAVPRPFFGSLFGISSLMVSAVLLLSLPSGTDYLYYYLPAADYLRTYHAFPPKLLPSFVDAPFAYPPAEFFLLYASFLAGPFQGLFIRAVMAAKATLFFYLLHRLARTGARIDVLALVALLPSQLLLTFVYSTDLNVVLAMQAVMLLYLEGRAARPPTGGVTAGDDKSGAAASNASPGVLASGASPGVLASGASIGVLAAALTGYALLSKYTFVPLYGLVLLFFSIRDRRRLPWLLLPLLPFTLFLAKNAALYGNPVFPLLAKTLNGLDAFQTGLLEAWTGVDLHLPWMLRTVKGICGSLLLLGLLLRPARDRLLTALVAGYVLFWAFAMNPDNTGDAGRFLIPAALVVIYALARESIDSRARVGMTGGARSNTDGGWLEGVSARVFQGLVLVQGVLFLLTAFERQQQVYGVLLMAYGVALPWLVNREHGRDGRRGSRLLRAPVWALAALALVCAARLAVKRSFDFADVGDSPYREEYAILRELLASGHTVLTDFYPLPLEMRMHPGLVYEPSVLGNDRYLEVVRAGAPAGVDYLLIPKAGLEARPWYSPRYRYREERTVRELTLFRVAPP